MRALRALTGIRLGDGERVMDLRMKRWEIPSHLTAGPLRWRVAAAAAVERKSNWGDGRC